MHVRLVHPSKRLEKWILTEPDIERDGIGEIIKFNTAFSIKPRLFIRLLPNLIEECDLMRIRKGRRQYRGNFPPYRALDNFPSCEIFSPDEAYKLAAIGLEYDGNSGVGHLEFKYDREDGITTQRFVINIHLTLDREKDISIGNYIDNFSGLFSSRFLIYFKQRLPIIAQITLKNFTTYGFKLGWSSNPYFLALMLTNTYLARKEHDALMAERTAFFTNVVFNLAQSNHGSDYRKPQLEPRHLKIAYHLRKNRKRYSLFSPSNGDFSGLALKEYKSFFKGVSQQVPVDDYSGYTDFFGISMPSFDGVGIAWTFEMDAVCFIDVKFVRADLRGLNLESAVSFTRCDFYGADLRGASIDLDIMDLATLLTLRHALLDPKIQEELRTEMAARRAEMATRPPRAMSLQRYI